jgi:hypothetical protein
VANSDAPNQQQLAPKAAHKHDGLASPKVTSTPASGTSNPLSVDWSENENPSANISLIYILTQRDNEA